MLVLLFLNILLYSFNTPQGRSRHPKKDVEEALQDAEAAGWVVGERRGHHGHAWGQMTCPGDCPIVWINSTPRNPQNHAKRLRRAVERCEHGEEER